MKEDDNIQLVEVFAGTPWEAQLVKGLLEDAGIQTSLRDEALGVIAPYLSQDTGVIVSSEDYEIAMQLIEDRNKK
jgi:hypothetical protein